MGLFTRNGDTPSLRQAFDRLETLERALRDLRIEWESAYDKIRRVLARLNKRDDRALAEAAGDAPEQEPPKLPNPGDARFAGLTPRQIHMQQEILRRRAGMRSGS